MSDTATRSRTLLQEIVARCSQLSVPVQAIMELTYRCNLRCAHCYIDVNEPDELTFNDWKAVIDQLKAAGTIYLLLTGGEIMVRPDIIDIAAYARRSGFIIRLMTNGTLLTHDSVHDLAELKPDSIATSLYGATGVTHDAVTGVPGSFEKTVEGIRLLVSHRLPPLVQTVVMKSNMSELAQIQALVAGLGAEASIDVGIGPSKSGAGYPFQCEPGVAELAGCGWHPASCDNRGIEGKGVCRAGKSLCSISPGGDVFPCLIFPLKLGNLKQSSFDKIWRLEPCAELRYLRSMRRTDLHACSRCELAAYCQRCTGIVYLETGRPDGASPSACRQAQTRWRLNHNTEVTPCLGNPTSNLK